MNKDCEMVTINQNLLNFNNNIHEIIENRI